MEKTVRNKVLITWVALNNDPFEVVKGILNRDECGSPVQGPTLSLLFNKNSFLCDAISHVCLLCRVLNINEKSGDTRVAEMLENEIANLSPLKEISTKKLLKEKKEFSLQRK